MNVYRTNRDITLLIFLPSPPDGGEFSASRSDRFNPEKEPRNKLNRRVSLPQSRYGRFGEEKNLFALQLIKHGTVQSVTIRYTDYTIPTATHIMTHSVAR